MGAIGSKLLISKLEQLVEIVGDLNLSLLLLAAGIAMLVFQIVQMWQPTQEVQLIEQMKEKELKALGPWLKYRKFITRKKALTDANESRESDAAGKYLSEDQCVSLVKTILTYRIQVAKPIITKSQTDRQSVFQRQFWSTWELQVDEMYNDLFKIYAEVEQSAIKFVGITYEDYQACLSHYFAYPQGFAQLCEINRQAIIADRTQKPCAREDIEQKETAWRWLMLKEAELEDKMDAVLDKGDPELYHRVKVMEYVRIEDQLRSEFSVGYRDFLWQKQVLELGRDEHTAKFVEDLQHMLDTSDKVNLGMAARLELWTMIEAGDAPVLYCQDSSGALLLHQSTMCALLTSMGKVLAKRYAFCMQSFIEFRQHLFKEVENNAEDALLNYKKVVRAIEGAQLKLKEEALSYLLFKLDISFDIYSRSIRKYMAESSTKQQVSRLLLAYFEQDPTEFADVFYSREQVLHATECLTQVRSAVIHAYIGTDKTAEMQEELSLKESLEYDRLFWEKQIDQRAYEHFIKQNKFQSDPKFREALANKAR